MISVRHGEEKCPCAAVVLFCSLHMSNVDRVVPEVRDAGLQGRQHAVVVRPHVALEAGECALWAFHGTSQESALDIAKNGIKPVHRRSLWGKGFYTTTPVKACLVLL